MSDQPAPDVPDEAVRAGADGFMRAEREPMCHPSEGPPLQSTQDVAHAVLEGALADPAARSALLAALGHDDESRPPLHDHFLPWFDCPRCAALADEWARRARRGEAELERIRRILDDGSAEPGATAAVVARREAWRHQVMDEHDEMLAERDRYREAHDALLDRAREAIAAWWEGHGDLDQALADLKQTVHAITDPRAALDGGER